MSLLEAIRLGEMPLKDIQAIGRVATARNEVLTFRSCGSWSKRWILNDYPTKGFHIKGKSSDWGPHAGLVPRWGKYSKVGGDDAEARKGDALNAEGIHKGFAQAIELVLTMKQIDMQCEEPADVPPRYPIKRKIIAPAPPELHVPESAEKDLILYAVRGGGKNYPAKQFAFLAQRAPGGRYLIKVFPDDLGDAGADVLVANKDRATALQVMASTEETGGAEVLAMTGDYDLFNVCPSFRDYASMTATSVKMPGYRLGHNEARRPGSDSLIFLANEEDRVANRDGWVNVLAGHMDRPMDPEIDPLGNQQKLMFKNRMIQYRGVNNPRPNHDLAKLQAQIEILKAIRAEEVKEFNSQLARNASDEEFLTWIEHRDMGNVSMRTVLCVQALNEAMGVNNFRRRVHHNTEAGRSTVFPGAGEAKMREGECFPITYFLPAAMEATEIERAGVIREFDQLKEFMKKVFLAGYYVPRSSLWNIGSFLKDLVNRNGGARSYEKLESLMAKKAAAIRKDQFKAVILAKEVGLMKPRIAKAQARSGAGKPKGNVAGKVTLKDVPLRSGSVGFFARDDTVIRAPIKADGTYKAADVPVGKVKVTVSGAPQLPISKAYHVPEKSGLTLDVHAGDNVFNIALS